MRPRHLFNTLTVQVTTHGFKEVGRHFGNGPWGKGEVAHIRIDVCRVDMGEGRLSRVVIVAKSLLGSQDGTRRAILERVKGAESDSQRVGFGVGIGREDMEDGGGVGGGHDGWAGGVLHSVMRRKFRDRGEEKNGG